MNTKTISITTAAVGSIITAGIATASPTGKDCR